MRLLALMLLAIDPLLAPSTISRARGVTVTGSPVLAPEPDYWEGPLFCGNGAAPRIERRSTEGLGRRLWVVCDARADGGR